tara:strand:- start:172 stop:339 length:168 start_codon:yes stop_codon:yes gene_type:complete
MSGILKNKKILIASSAIVILVLAVGLMSESPDQLDEEQENVPLLKKMGYNIEYCV